MNSQERIKLLRPYKRRNIILSKMGFGSYREYLCSDTWRDIRARVLNRDNYECYGCGGTANTAHHSCYSEAAMTGRSIDGLWSLCGLCHKFIEFKKDGSKARISDVRSRLNMLASMNGRSIKKQRQSTERFKVKCDRCGKYRRPVDVTGPVCKFCVKRECRKSLSSGEAAIVGGQSGRM